MGSTVAPNKTNVRLARMNVDLFIRKDYEDASAFGSRKTDPIQADGSLRCGYGSSSTV